MSNQPPKPGFAYGPLLETDQAGILAHAQKHGLCQTWEEVKEFVRHFNNLMPWLISKEITEEFLQQWSDPKQHYYASYPRSEYFRLLYEATDRLIFFTNPITGRIITDIESATLLFLMATAEINGWRKPWYATPYLDLD